VGAPRGGVWRQLLNTDAAEYAGSGLPTPESCEATPGLVHGRPFSLALTLPPLAAVFWKPDPEPEPEQEPGAAEEPAIEDDSDSESAPP
jgi:1,4-alpha-glucan branching enzyme